MQQLRQELDLLDDQIVQLFLQRMDIVKSIAQQKKVSNLPIENKQRESEIITRLTQKFGQHNYAVIKQLYELIFTMSKQLQNQL